MARDPDNPHGMQFRGRERALRFVHPYRHVGELNSVEQLKLQRHPFEVAQAVIERYAVQGVAALASVPGEMERLKWVGLYPQRQGGDAFMMRIKVPGGVMSAAQIREIGVVAEAYAEGPDDSPVFGNRYADLTTRQDIQLHWLRIEDIPRVWARFHDVGLTTVQACGDSARNVCSCPVAGVDADEVVDALPVARAISAFFTGNREYANLPRKFKIAVTGCREDCARVEIDDIGLWPARADDGALGFNVLVGGGLSDGERMASDIDLFIDPSQAVELCRAVAQVFGELGNRENRGLARMRYLVQELGPEGFRAELGARTRFALAPAGEELTRRFRGDHVGVHPQRTPGMVYVGCSVPVGRMRGIELVEVARLAEVYGDGTVRVGTDQNFVITGVPEERVDVLLAEPLLQKYSPFPGAFERGVVACTGSEFCRFAVVETKERAVKWARWMDAQLSAAEGEEQANGARGAHEDAGVIRMHFSGCSASCAQPQVADIGFRGDVAHVGQHLSEAVDIGMGGSLGPDAAFIDWIAGAVPVADVPQALLRVVLAYRGECASDEPFYRWARRTSPEHLRALVEGSAVEDAGAADGERPPAAAVEAEPSPAVAPASAPAEPEPARPSLAEPAAR
jgi:ferredoxin-nitrite reductase